MEIQQSILNGSFLNESFQESLKPSTFVSDVLNIAERSRHSFDDILGLTKEISSPAGVATVTSATTNIKQSSYNKQNMKDLQRITKTSNFFN